LSRHAPYLIFAYFPPIFILRQRSPFDVDAADARLMIIFAI